MRWEDEGERFMQSWWSRIWTESESRRSRENHCDPARIQIKTDFFFFCKRVLGQVVIRSRPAVTPWYITDLFSIFFSDGPPVRWQNIQGGGKEITLTFHSKDTLDKESLDFIIY